MSNYRKRMSCTPINLPRSKNQRHATTDSNQQQQHRPLVIVLAGPTAVGKSDVAAELCSHSMATDIITNHRRATLNQNDKMAGTILETRGHVVSADSVQVYRGVNIGANKPSLEEMERTPHHLVDIVDPPNHDTQGKGNTSSYNSTISASSYNAADWMRDAEYVIRKLTLLECDDEDGVQQTNGADEEMVARRKVIDNTLDESLNREEMTPRQPILPVVVGGTMMYLTWLVHGRPDAMRPTDEAKKRAAGGISKFQRDSQGTANALDGPLEAISVVNAEFSEEQENERAWANASAYVSSLGPVFANRVAKLCGRDWYRLRRLLEVAYTIADTEKKSASDCAETNEAAILNELTDGEVYTGIRSGSLEESGYDVRCFFLCPNERMLHFHTVDQRCEEMLLRGLLRETANLYVNGGLPEDSQVTRAIGYRQTLDYLLRKNAKIDDSEAFLSFVEDFATATRQYAKRQMQWFRRDSEFAFIPVNMETDKNERVKGAAGVIADLCQLPRQDFLDQLAFDINDTVSSQTELPLSAQTKVMNERQGKGMKFFISKREKLLKGSTLLSDLLMEADECTKLVQGIHES
jgi:tRNA dimethylallyltransferase